MTSKKTKSVTNTKVTKINKKPSKEEMFTKAIMPTFESMIEADLEKLDTAQTWLSIKDVCDRIVITNVDSILIDTIKTKLKEWINELKLIIDKWSYKSFMDIKKNPFPCDKVAEANPNYKDIALCYLKEIMVGPYLQRIQEGQRQLDNCED